MRMGNWALRSVVLVCTTLFASFAWCEPGIVWQGRSPVPKPVQWAAGAAVGGRAYLFGGICEEASGALTVTGDVQIYDPAADTWAHGTTMPEPRCLASAVVLDGKIYVMGGLTEPKGSPSNRNDVYDPASGAWSSARALPVSLSGHAAAAFAGKIYVMGGVSGNYQSAVSIYDPASHSWSAGAVMPQSLAFGALAASGNKLAWLGGAYRPLTSPFDCFGGVLLYDPAANAWASESPALALPVLTYGQAAVDPSSGKVYLAGGETVDKTTSKIAAARVVQCYDPATGSVSLAANMPSPKGRCRGVFLPLGDRVFQFAGLGDPAVGETLGLVDAYKPAQDAWDRALPDLPEGGGGTGGFTAVVGRSIVNVRGFMENSPDGKVDVYDMDSKTWQTKAGISPTPAFDFAAGEWNGKIVVSGGLSAGFKVVAKTFLYDPAGDTWAPLASDPTARFVQAGAVLEGKFYVFGGDTSTSTTVVIPDLHVLDLAAGTWSTKKPMPFAMEGMVAVPCQGKIYLLGGTKGDFTKPGKINAQTLVYDSATDSYDVSKAPMPRPVVFHAGTAWEHFVVVHGGHYWRTTNGQSALAISNATQVYDTETNEWTMAEGLFGRTDHRAAAADGTLFLVSGTDPDGTACLRLSAGRITGTGSVELTASSSADRTSGPAPLTVRLTASAAGGTPPYTFSWQFDEGGSSTEQNPSWTFSEAGSHTANLTVKDAAGDTSEAPPIAITVSSIPPPAVTAMAKLGGPFRINVTGSGLQNGVKVFIGADSSPWSGVTWKSSSKLLLTGGSALKAKAPKGQDIAFRFLNPDGGEAVFTFRW